VTLARYFDVVVAESPKPKYMHYLLALGIFGTGIGFLLSGRIE